MQHVFTEELLERAIYHEEHAVGSGWYLEATVEDLHSLLAPQGHVHGDLLVTADTE
jgi:hypothetical protein